MDREALKSISLEKLQELCIKQDMVPELRGEIWSILLSCNTDEVKMKTEENGDYIKEILNLHCSTNSCSVTEGMKKVLNPIMKLDLSSAAKYHLFTSVVKTYLPLSDLKCFSLLFRLLLLYHDPLLCMHFDGSRVQPEAYVSPWIENLFVDLVSNVENLWDAFFCRDSIFIVFFAVALLMKKRDSLLSDKKIDLSIGDTSLVFEMFKMAIEIEKETPFATRNQIESIFYPSKETNFKDLYQYYVQNVILPIPTSEVIEVFRHGTQHRKPVKYIIIDCRSFESFTFARLPTAVHIGTNVRYDEKKMNSLVKQFESAKGSHFTIFGTGRIIQDEQNFLNLIAMRFIQHGFPHVSIATEGFKGCIKYITTNEIEYVRDEKKPEQEFSITDTLQSFGNEIFGWGKKQIEDISNKEEKSNNNFTLEDDDEDIETGGENNSFQIGDRLIKLENIKKLDKFTSYKAHVIENPQDIRFVIVSGMIVMVLKPHPREFGFAYIVWKRLITQVLKISYKKEDNHIVTFLLKGKPDTIACEDDEGEFQELLYIEDSLACIQNIQENFVALNQKPKPKE